jgi:hypothetical protein
MSYITPFYMSLKYALLHVFISRTLINPDKRQRVIIKSLVGTRCSFDKNSISISIINPLLLHYPSEYTQNGLHHSQPIHGTLQISSPANPLGPRLS